jgi:hypothetical protein
MEVYQGRLTVDCLSCSFSGCEYQCTMRSQPAAASHASGSFQKNPS